MKSEADNICRTKNGFSICLPCMAVHFTAISFPLVLLLFQHEDAWILLVPFEDVSGIFRSFAREDAGNAASGLWRWLVCLCHPSLELLLSWCIIEPLNQLPRLLSPTFLPVRDRDCEPDPKGREEKKKGQVTEKSRLHSSPSLIYTWGVMGLLCAT